MFNGHRRIPPPVNDPVKNYAPGSPERASIKARLSCMAGEVVDIPLIIGGKAVTTGSTADAVMPHDHKHVLGHYHKASEAHVQQAIAAAQAAHDEWASWSFDDRAAIMLKAAELLTTTWRDTINAATMLGQSKTVFQAEIDSGAEIVDFWRFNVHYGQELLDEQPVSDHTMWNQLEYRALEGFVYAVTPFNFTSIAANLPTAPALMGNTVVWKPASSAMFAAHYLMKLYEAAGMIAGIKALLDEAVEAGELLRCDTTRLARAVQGLIGGSLLQWAIDREGKAADRLREDLDSLLKPRHCPPRNRRRFARPAVRKV